MQEPATTDAGGTDAAALQEAADSSLADAQVDGGVSDRQPRAAVRGLKSRERGLDPLVNEPLELGDQRLRQQRARGRSRPDPRDGNPSYPPARPDAARAVAEPYRAYL